jgi:hypothetical protein
MQQLECRAVLMLCKVMFIDLPHHNCASITVYFRNMYIKPEPIADTDGDVDEVVDDDEFGDVE